MIRGSDQLVSRISDRHGIWGAGLMKTIFPPGGRRQTAKRSDERLCFRLGRFAIVFRGKPRASTPSLWSFGHTRGGEHGELRASGHGPGRGGGRGLWKRDGVSARPPLIRPFGPPSPSRGEGRYDRPPETRDGHQERTARPRDSSRGAFPAWPRPAVPDKVVRRWVVGETARGLGRGR